MQTPIFRHTGHQNHTKASNYGRFSSKFKRLTFPCFFFPAKTICRSRLLLSEDKIGSSKYIHIYTSTKSIHISAFSYVFLRYFFLRFPAVFFPAFLCGWIMDMAPSGCMIHVKLGQVVSKPKPMTGSCRVRTALYRVESHMASCHLLVDRQALLFFKIFSNP